MAGLSALSPMEIALVTVALVGCIPVIVQYRDRSKWFAVGYGTLVVAAISTNAESLVLPTVFNYMEHGVGLMGAGLAFFAAAYVHRRELTESGADDRGPDRERELATTEEVAADG